jgi:hypothetical protein
MRFICSLSFSLILFSAAGQNNNIIVSPEDNGKKFGTLLKEIEENHRIDIISNNEELFQVYTVNGVTEEIYLVDFLEMFLKPLGLVPVEKNNVILLVTKETFNEFGNRKGNFIIVKTGDNNGLVNIQGEVKDQSGQPLIGTLVSIPKLKLGDISDVDGSFSFNVKKGIHQLNGSFLGFEPINYIVGFSPLGKTNEISMILSQSSIQLAGVSITARKSDTNVKSTITGVSTMKITTIKELASFMGEVDVIRGITTMPGVSTAGELSSGFNVRGGDVGQNLILQDEAIITNPTHLFGFFSAFNPDLVSDVSLYKGGGPANYGGRISSVLKVNLRNGDAGRYGVNGGVGLVSSRLTVEGPIKRNKSSFIIGGRISYVNWLIKALNNKDLTNSAANFGDISAKLYFDINKNNAISFTNYTSYDNFKLNSDSTFIWRTQNISLKWDHSFNDKLYSKLNISNSNYLSKVENRDPVEGSTFSNSINNFRLNYDLNSLFTDKFEFYAGIDINQAEIEPGRLEPTSLGVNSELIDINNQHSLEAALFVNNDFDLSNRLSFSLGLRFSNFWRYGEDEIFTYDENDLNGRYPSIIDTTSYSRGEVVKYYNGWEPRLSMRYLITSNFSLKASYYRTYQYIHLVSNTVSVTPQDFWIASSPSLEPERADQFSLGLFANYNKDKVELSVEGFYKNLDNVIDYIEGADNFLNQAMESGLIQGEGIAYGIEAMAKRNDGKLNGWVSYTYSRSLRKFNSDLQYKTINTGQYYPSVYDQPHNLSIVLNYKISPFVTLSSNFSYSTGRPITIPISKISYEHYLTVLSYSDRNEYRIPNYHRLDLSLTIKDKPKQNKIIRGEWVLGIYNVYGRKNAYSIFFKGKGDAYKMSILGTVFPSISYNFKL